MLRKHAGTRPGAHLEIQQLLILITHLWVISSFLFKWDTQERLLLKSFTIKENSTKHLVIVFICLIAAASHHNQVLIYFCLYLESYSVTFLYFYSHFEGIFSVTPVVASEWSLLHMNNPVHVYSVQCFCILPLPSKHTRRACSWFLSFHREKWVCPAAETRGNIECTRWLCEYN